MPRRIQRKRTKGWRLPPNTVCVTRPGRWGNPFAIGMWTGFTAADAVRDFTRWINGDLSYITAGRPPSHSEIRKELRGKDLACWCKPGSPCHAEVLLKIANGGKR